MPLRPSYASAAVGTFHAALPSVRLLSRGRAGFAGCSPVRLLANVWLLLFGWADVTPFWRCDVLGGSWLALPSSAMARRRVLPSQPFDGLARRARLAGLWWNVRRQFWGGLVVARSSSRPVSVSEGYFLTCRSFDRRRRFVITARARVGSRQCHHRLWRGVTRLHALRCQSVAVSR